MLCPEGGYLFTHLIHILWESTIWVFAFPVDAGPLDLRSLLCLLRRGRLRLLLPRLPERGGVVLPPAGLEEPDCHAHLKASAQETGNNHIFHIILCQLDNNTVGWGAERGATDETISRRLQTLWRELLDSASSLFLTPALWEGEVRKLSC